MRETTTYFVIGALLLLSASCDSTTADDTPVDEPKSADCASLTPLLGNCRLEEERSPADLSVESFNVDLNNCEESYYLDGCPSVPGLECLSEWPSSILIVSSQAALDVVQDGCNGLSLPRAVDFATEKVVVYSHNMGTCGNMDSSYRLYRTAAGDVDVALFFWTPDNPFGGSATDCDWLSEGTHGLIIPATTSPHACLYEHPPCLDFDSEVKGDPSSEKLCATCLTDADCPGVSECRSAVFGDYCGPKVDESLSECPGAAPTSFDQCVKIGKTCRYDQEGTFGYSIMECTCEGWILIDEAD